MNYKQLAEKALERRKALVDEAKAINESNASNSEKRARLDSINKQIEAVTDEARGFIEQAEAEADVRGIAARLGGLVLPSGEGGRDGQRSAVLTDDEKRHADGTWLLNEVRTVTGAAGLGSAVTPAENSVKWFDRLAPRTVALASGINVIHTNADSLVIPRLTADPTAAWVAEAGTITPSDPNGDTVTAVPRKVAVLTDVTNESIRDSRPALLDVHGKAIMRAAGNAFDLGVFEGTGTAPQIRGMRNISGIQNISMGTNGAVLTNLDWAADALSMLDSANADSGNAVIVMPVRTWQGLLKLKEQTSGSNKPLLSESATSPGGKIERRIYGVPVYLTTQLSLAETQGTSNLASSIYIYDRTQQFAVVRQEAELFLDPFSKSDQDLTRVRLTLRADFVSANAASIVRVAGVL